MDISGVNPYQRNWEEYEEYKTLYTTTHDQKPLPIFADQGKDYPVWITPDGKIIANGFIDENDSLEFYQKDEDTIRFSLYKDSITDKVYDIQTDQKYVTTGTLQQTLQEEFGYCSHPISPVDETKRKKFLQLNKLTKSLARGLITTKDRFHFHFNDASGDYFALPKINGNWFRSFNHNIFINPRGLVDGVRDLIVIKTGEYYQMPASPVTSLIAYMTYSTGTSGNMYINTLSIPEDYTSNSFAAEDTEKWVKIPRLSNSGVGQASTPLKTPVGTIGVVKDGVLLTSYKNGLSYGGSGIFHENWHAMREVFYDSCNGDLIEISTHSGQGLIDTYHYKSAPYCLYNTGDSTGHSPLLGYAFDGHPIYGPYGYSGSNNSNNPIKRMEPSYRLKTIIGNRPSGGPDYSIYKSGMFIEDFEYVSGLGDLDQHNGRLCVTPEYPSGVYAYFTTVDEDHKPKFPYIIGDTFYGNVDLSNYTGVSTEEPTVLKTGSINQADIDLWQIYGILNTERAGLKKETIVYVTPHELRTANGVFLKTGQYSYVGSGTGIATYSGAIFNATGGNKFIAEKVSYKYPTSNLYSFDDAYSFSGNMPYMRTDPDTKTVLNLTGHNNMSDTNFYSLYSGYKSGFNDRLYSGNWDGVIPSGTPFKIEVWSFNGAVNGYNGELSMKPCVPHPSISGKLIILEGTFTGEANDEGESYSDMLEKANHELRKNLNTFLMNESIINTPNSVKKFKQLMLNNTAKV
tara:strand:- start:748 stop:2967 length:2220 start_codon:yes stop_codon:yes gene_type:complete